MTAHGAYSVTEQALTHGSALVICQLMGGHLPATETVSEHEEFVAGLKDINFTQRTIHSTFAGAWFGLIYENGIYKWRHTGKDVVHVNLMPGQNNEPGKECSLLYNGFVVLCTCGIKLRVICEHDLLQ